jgi:hypothetical protein
MTGPLQVLLTAGPLAFYLYILAIWHGGRHPRIISGPVNAALLAFGIGSLLTFGPFGQLVATMLFGVPGALHWLALTLAMVLAGLLMVRWSARRLVVYHVDPEILDRAMEDVLDLWKDRYIRTIGGFEDRSRLHGLTVQVVPLLGTAVIEAIGPDPEPLIQDLTGRLQAHLERAPTPSTSVAGILYGLSALTMLIALAGMFLTQPRAHEALRVLLQRLQGG